MRFAVALHAAGLRLALASSSKNVAAMLRRLTLPDGRTLLSIFDADLSGTDVPRGKPDPALFLLAAKALKVPPAQCVVVEDAPAGIAAARAGAWPPSVSRGLATRPAARRRGPTSSLPASIRSMRRRRRRHLARPARNGDACSCMTPWSRRATQSGF